MGDAGVKWACLLSVIIRSLRSGNFSTDQLARGFYRMQDDLKILVVLKPAVGKKPKENKVGTIILTLRISPVSAPLTQLIDGDR